MPVVISLAGGELVSLPEIRYGLGVKLRTRIPVRWALRRARIVTAGSSYLMKLADQQLPPASLRLLPLGVDLRRWPYPRQEPDSPVIINVGALEPVKGQAILLLAFQQVHLQMPSVRLRIVGGGRMLDELGRMAADLHLSPYVRFAGPVLHHELGACYSGASIFVQSSWHEAQGMALLEAAACGLPIAGTTVGTLADFTPEAAVGAPVGEAGPLAETVLKLLTCREDAMALGLQARKQIEEAYALESAAERFLQLYQSIL
jgi:glycosyltransferase involved in cell wall biosynthesis